MHLEHVKRLFPLVILAAMPLFAGCARETDPWTPESASAASAQPKDDGPGTPFLGEPLRKKFLDESEGWFAIRRRTPIFSFAPWTLMTWPSGFSLVAIPSKKRLMALFSSKTSKPTCTAKTGSLSARHGTMRG